MTPAWSGRRAPPPSTNGSAPAICNTRKTCPGRTRNASNRSAIEFRGHNTEVVVLCPRIYIAPPEAPPPERPPPPPEKPPPRPPPPPPPPPVTTVICLRGMDLSYSRRYPHLALVQACLTCAIPSLQ